MSKNNRTHVTGRNSSPVPTLILKQSVLLLLALHLPLEKMEVFASKYLLQMQELVARQFIFKLLVQRQAALHNTQSEPQFRGKPAFPSCKRICVYTCLL